MGLREIEGIIQFHSAVWAGSLPKGNIAAANFGCLSHEYSKPAKN